jgi:hypothetical protein
MKNYTVTLDIDADLYLKWKAYNESKGIKSSGHYASIRKVNSLLFTEALIEAMEK